MPTVSGAIASAARLLPAQGPIGIFIHHNTLHAFEHLPFERAVVEAGALFGCEPFLPERRYRRELARGRIRREDVEAALDDALGDTGTERIAGVCTRRELRAAILLHGIPAAEGPEVLWLARETEALDSPAARALFDACVALADRARPAALVLGRRLVRVRDRLITTGAGDIDELVHPVLIRVCAAFMDQGIAQWQAPERELGFYRWFLRLHGSEAAGQADPFMRTLAQLARDEASHEDESQESIRRSLSALSVAEADTEAFVVETLLALRGWAGMARQMEERPDRVPAHAPKISLEAFLAVRLLLERAAVALVGGDIGRLPIAAVSSVPTPLERAWALFHVSKRLGVGAGEIAGLAATDASALLEEIESFPETERRRLLHLAYERRHLHHVLDAISRHTPERSEEPPEHQVVFCIDEREESLRRHLEEVAPRCETWGAAGFFGVAMYFKGVGDAHARPLCPIAIVPAHEVEELPLDPGAALVSLRRSWRRGMGHLSHGLAVGSRTFVRGTLIAALAGALASIPLVLRVLFPRLAARLRRGSVRFVQPPSRTRLALDRRPEVTPSLGRHAGYTKEEMAAIVRGQLEAMGMARFAPLVLFVGHGSSSLNNPHESAHDCGACGGGHGGPNARAFAQMANDPAVRAILRDQGVEIPDETWFVGAEHNTSDDEVTYFDADAIPEAFVIPFRKLASKMRRAVRRNAHERSRRFDNAPTWLPPELAKAHVEARAEDLAQPRPEYGHATNAVCVIGRRSRTRGLFFDRRAFLVSYDPSQDDAQGAVLARLLAAAVPVVAGINLEYYFGYVDPVGYGCGTKAPHNVTGLLGVMDGHASDLRTGLPWQMLEIHEPVRLLIVIEAEVEVVRDVIARDPALSRLVGNGWVRVATLHPERPEVHVRRADGFVRHEASADLPVVATSADWYRGERGPLLPAAVRRPAAEGQR